MRSTETKSRITLERAFHQWVYPPVSCPNEGSGGTLTRVC